MSNTTDTASTDRSRRIKFWGVGIVLLMILLMLLPINLTGRSDHGGHNSPTMGTTRDGGRVTAEDISRAGRLLDTLESIYVAVGQMPPERLPEVCWGPEIVQAFRRDPAALHLVLVASRKAGPGTNPIALGPLDPDQRSTQEVGIFNSGRIFADQLHAMPSSPLARAMQGERVEQLAAIRVVGPDRRSLVEPTKLSTADQHLIYDALNDFLTIQSAASMTGGAMKVSRPLVDRLVAELAQKMTLRAAGIDASAQLAAVPAPGDAQLAEHFAKYAGTAPGVATKENPFAFGYRVPDRVKIEWIAIDVAAVRAVVEAEKTPFQWEVDARLSYAKNPAALAALAPTSQPATDATTAPATSQPTFDSVKDNAIRRYIDGEVDKRLNEIERAVRGPLTNDYQLWTVARSAKTTTAPSSVNVAIDAADYLDRVAAFVGDKVKVSLQVERLTDTLRDRQSLASASPSFAALARSTTMNFRGLSIPSTEPAPTYAIRAASTQPAAANEETIAPFQPSQTVTDGAKRVIFRVTEADPSHPAPDLASVREQVAYDWRIAQAQTIALQKAAAEAEAIRQNRPTSPDLAWKSVTLNDTPQATAELGLAADAMAQFRDAANDALLTDAPAAQPAASIGVPLARRAYVVQRQRLEPMWQTDEQLAALRDDGRTGVARAMAEPATPENPFGLTGYSVGSAWLDVKKIYDRTGWKPVNAEAK